MITFVRDLVNIHVIHISAMLATVNRTFTTLSVDSSCNAPLP